MDKKKKKKPVDTRPVACITAGMSMIGPRVTVVLDRGTDWEKLAAVGDAIAEAVEKHGYRLDLEQIVTADGRLIRA